MTRWQHFLSAIRFPKSEIVITVVRADRMSDAELTRVLRSAPDAHLLYRAFMQMLEDLREDAITNIADDSTSSTAMAADAGGAKYLKALRDEILRRRASKKSSKSQAPSSRETPSPNV